MSNASTPPPSHDDPARQVSGPATGLLITGIIGAIFTIFGSMLGMAGRLLQSMMSDGMVERYAHMFSGSMGFTSSIVGLLVAGFLIWASTKMKALTNFEICIAASILAMIPCVSPCCIVGLPIGIWSLIVLLKPEVKAAFH